MIVAQGGAFGGWSLYVKDGKPAYCYNLFGLERFKVYGDEPLAEGDHQVRVEFAYDGGGLGKGGTASLFLDGARSARDGSKRPCRCSSRPTRPSTSAPTAAPR